MWLDLLVKFLLHNVQLFEFANVFGIKNLFVISWLGSSECKGTRLITHCTNLKNSRFDITLEKEKILNNVWKVF